MTLSEERISRLIEQIRTGDQAASNALIAGMRERILRWALVITGDIDDAEDVAQTVSLTLHKRAKDFEGRSRFTTWVYAAVRNAALDQKRRRVRTEHESIDDDAVIALTTKTEDVLQQISDNDAARAVRGFFEELAPRQRELIELVDQQGLSAAVAAEMLGIEPETARVHLMRGRRALRARMLERHPEMFDR
ncbi:MAG TPA: RNA polymerase sigma factor [Longimicrobiales bacterium]|nr:RNA polymerase sigma factor [Longimicrobiales bacterium]